MTVYYGLRGPRQRVALAGALMLGASLAGATAASAQFDEEASEALVERVKSAQSSEYQRVLDELDAYLRQHHDDAVVAVERCRFIDFFANSEELFIEAASEDAENCESDLRESPHAESGAAKLYLWEQQWSDEAITEGERLLADSQSWTPRQRAALHEHLSGRYSQSDPIKSGVHALAAVRLNPESGSRLAAAEHLVRIGAKRRAVEMILGMPSKRWHAWTLQSAITTLIGMGETRAARELVVAHGDIELDPTSRIKLARALIDAREVNAGWALAKSLVTGSKLPEHFGTRLEREVFEFQRDHGTRKQAIAAYRNLRNTGFAADAFARYRVSLTTQHWSAPWRWADMAGVGALLLALAFAALLPVMVIVPIHYRSSVKRARGFLLPPLSDESPWSLSELWYALAVLLVGSSVTLYVFSYPDFEALFGRMVGVTSWMESLSDSRALGRAVLWGDFLCALALLPLLRGKRVRELLVGQWSVVRSVVTGIGLAIVLLIVNGLFTVWLRHPVPPGVGIGTDTVRALQGISESYGALALIASVGLITPIIEEFVFRGVFLRATSRHVGFWLAALAQAVVFVLWHEEVAAYPYLFALALVASWLAWRSGGLLAPIVLHVTNNIFAALAIIGVTRFVNATP